MNMMEKLGGAVQDAWSNLTAGGRHTDDSVSANKLGYRHALGITLHDISVEAIEGGKSEIVGSSTSIGWGPKDLAEAVLPKDLPENLKWADALGQTYALIPVQDTRYATLVSNRSIDFTDDLQDQVRKLMAWPEPKPIDLGVVDFDPHFG
jgi:hypothetical protein